MKKAFTLIELLIVVAIIAILAAIAVPNFLEAQTRAKVARVKADMRSIATALESYAVDTNKYPLDGQGQIPALATPIEYAGTAVSVFGTAHINNMLSTPIAYLTNVQFKDPFVMEQSGVLSTLRYFNLMGTYLQSSDATRIGLYKTHYGIYGSYVLSSFGPNKATDTVSATNTPIEGIPGADRSALMTRYDATNGTVSRGDVMRCQKTSDNPAYGVFPM